MKHSLIFPFSLSNLVKLFHASFYRKWPASCHVFVKWPVGQKKLDHTELNASVNKPNKARSPSLNPKQSEVSPLIGEVVYNLRKMLFSTQRRELLQFETITKHTLG